MNTAHARGPGEPNKLCDTLAAAISEEYQKRDGLACTDIRVSGGRGALFITGLVSSSADFDVATLVKQTLGKVDPSLNLEPFITIESTGNLKRSSAQTTGYATKETTSFLPRSVDVARHCARTLENVRQGEDAWFWLSPDFDITTNIQEKKVHAEIRLSHIDEVTIEQIRKQVSNLFLNRVDKIRVNTAGAEKGNGLAKCLGSSGQNHYEWYGAKLPGESYIFGAELAHPANIGWMMARHLAKEFVEQGVGQAVMVDLFWSPLEDIPSQASARNEKGKDLSSLINLEQLSRKRLVKKWGTASLMKKILQVSFDGSVELAFEQKDFLS